MANDGFTAKVVGLGDATLSGWQRKVVSPIADRVSERTRFTPEQIRAFVGFALLAISAYSLLKRARRTAVRA